MLRDEMITIIRKWERDPRRTPEGLADAILDLEFNIWDYNLHQKVTKTLRELEGE